MTELQILAAIQTNGGYMESTALLNLGLSHAQTDLQTYKAQIKKLKENGYISGILKPYSNVMLTPEGRLHLAALKNEAENKSQQEKQQRFDNKISILSVLVPFISFILGLVVEHYADIVTLFFSLF